MVTMLVEAALKIFPTMAKVTEYTLMVVLTARSSVTTVAKWRIQSVERALGTRQICRHGTVQAAARSRSPLFDRSWHSLGVTGESTPWPRQLLHCDTQATRCQSWRYVARRISSMLATRTAILWAQHAQQLQVPATNTLATWFLQGWRTAAMLTGRSWNFCVFKFSSLFSTLWAIAELSGRWVVATEGKSAGLSAWMRPGDLRTFAKAVVSAAGRGSALHPQTVLLARYAVGHTLFLDGKLDKAAFAIETAVTAIADDTEYEGLAESRLVLTSLHVLYAHVLLAQGNREAAVDRCVALAGSDMDFNIVYRCVLPRLPLPVPQASRPAFTLDEIDRLLSRVAAETPHGGSSVTNLHLADIAQWKSFGSRSDSLLRLLPQDDFSDAGTTARLQCDVASSAVKSARKLKARDVKLLIVVPAVAQEGTRLVENLREWARDRQFPCSGETDVKQQTDLMLLFSRTPAETPSWLQSGSNGGPDQAFAGLVGEAAQTCFGRTTVRFANLTAAQEYYRGAWVATGPNNLFYPLLVEDDEIHDGRYDYIFWMETDAFPVQRGWLDRLREESTSPRGFWRKGPTQRPLLPPDMLGMVGPHHYHMNAVGWYRVGDPCYREFLRCVRENHREEPFDVSQHRYLHDRASFNIFQEWAHKFVYTDVLQNWIGAWKLGEVLATSPNTVIVHGKERL